MLDVHLIPHLSYYLRSHIDGICRISCGFDFGCKREWWEGVRFGIEDGFSGVGYVGFGIEVGIEIEIEVEIEVGIEVEKRSRFSRER